MTDSDREMQTVGDFKDGSITKIVLKNFLTYRYSVIRPGPRLNMVVGANGTGKSSLLNAICLGLGGNPSILGRADDVRAFIQHDATVAEIAITLQGGHTFRRVLDRTKGTAKGRGRGASTYFINDKPASQDEVLEIVRTTYQIRLENLCTFLPQDKVGSFSAMDHKQLLAATQQTVPNNLYERHLELIADEEAVRHSSTDWEALESKLTTLQQEHGRLEEAKEKMELREKMMERMKLLEQKKVWLEVEVLREQARELKTHRTEKKNVLREKGDQLAPMEEQLAEIRAVLDSHNQAYKQLQQKETKLKEVLSKQKDKYAAHDDAFEQEIMEWRDWANQIQDLKRQVEVAEQKVVDLRTTLEEMPSLESLQEIEKTSKEDFIGLRSQVKGAHRSLAAMQDKIRECEETSKRWGNKLNALANQSKQRRENIFRKHPNLGKVHQWVQENASRFRKPVCGPICCEVNPSSPAVAALVEQHVSNKIWNSFVVQTDEDYQLLFREVREKLKIPVNVFNVGNQEWQSKRPYSDPKMQVLREQHGVLGYMDELVECSDAARQVLCNMSGIDKLVVGSAKTQESIDKRNLLAFLSEPEVAGQPMRGFAIATESQKYNCIISRYSKTPSHRIDTIRPARLLASGTDPAEQQHAEEQLRVAHEALQSLRPDFQKANDEHQRVEAAAQEAKASFDTAKVRVASFLKYQGKLENAMKKRDDLKDRAGQGTDTEEVKRRADLLKNRKMASLSALEVHAAKQEELLQVNLAQAAASLSKTCAVARDHQVRSNFEDLQKEVNALKAEMTELSRQFTVAKDKLRSKMVEGQEKAPIHDENGNDLPLHGILEGLGLSTLVEVEEAHEEAQAVAAEIHDNPEALAKYNQQKDEIEDLSVRLDEAKKHKGVKLNNIKAKRQPWEASLQKTVDKINALFSNYMTDMGNSGEICLRKGEEGEGEYEGLANFSDWGIDIKVSFRGDQKTQVLSAMVQSGGERSVSTIMYLMALQDMMVSPFRCVDEINQGLDDRNERLVFKRIVKNSTSPPKSFPQNHTGQYFLITPKLLPNLTDMEEEAMTILFVMNGAFNFKDPEEWNVEDIIAAAGKAIHRKRQKVVGEENDEENSFNSLPRRIGKKSKPSPKN